MFRTLHATATLSLLVLLSLATCCESTFAQVTDNQPDTAAVIATIDVAVAFESTTGDSKAKLAGAVMTNGQAIANQTVWLQTKNGKHATQTKTDGNGKFDFTITRGGAYVVRTEDAATVCRVWPVRQAPPIAVREVLLTCKPPMVVRGQDYVSYEGAGCDNGSYGSGGVPGGFQNCDSSCGEPPMLSNCNTSSLFGGCGCGGGCKGGCCGECGGGFFGGGGRSKLLLGLLGGAVIGYALDEDDGPLEAEVGS